jgi:low affinity Fe/Cu permease
MASKIGDWVECQCGKPLALVLFILCVIIGPKFNLDATNYGISVFTAGLLLLTVNGARRSDKAMHTKLDDLERAVGEARSENARLEERTEQEIEAVRDDAT